MASSARHPEVVRFPSRETCLALRSTYLLPMPGLGKIFPSLSREETIFLRALTLGVSPISRIPFIMAYPSTHILFDSQARPRFLVGPLLRLPSLALGLVLVLPLRFVTEDGPPRAHRPFLLLALLLGARPLGRPRLLCMALALVQGLPLRLRPARLPLIPLLTLPLLEIRFSLCRHSVLTLCPPATRVRLVGLARSGCSGPPPLGRRPWLFRSRLSLRTALFPC